MQTANLDYTKRKLKVNYILYCTCEKTCRKVIISVTFDFNNRLFQDFIKISKIPFSDRVCSCDFCSITSSDTDVLKLRE